MTPATDRPDDTAQSLPGEAGSSTVTETDETAAASPLVPETLPTAPPPAADADTAEAAPTAEPTPDGDDLPATAESESTALRVDLEHFQGPLDLLLHLIKREKVDISEIPIAKITRQYLETIETMQLLNLEVAGDFLVMAATLMRIKSRTLLPPSPIEDEEGEGDPREELVRRLLEYRKYKEVAQHLRSQEETRSRQHAKGYTPRVTSDELAPLKPISLFHLVDVLQAVLKRERQPDSVHAVELPPVTVEECMEEIRERLAGAWGQIRFEEILGASRTRIEVITIFVSLLELIRLGEVVARQYEDLGDIWLFDPERLGIENQMTAVPAGEGLIGATPAQPAWMEESPAAELPVAELPDTEPPTDDLPTTESPATEPSTDKLPVAPTAVSPEETE